MAKSKSNDQFMNVESTAFIRTLMSAGFIRITSWQDGGHDFQLFHRGAAHVLVQIYPDGHGFEVWRPVTQANDIMETLAAVQNYAEEVK